MCYHIDMVRRFFRNASKKTELNYEQAIHRGKATASNVSLGIF